ncbi:MAG: MFS transporter [Dehalococcoidia bacterium]|jgi:MFS family permease
MADSEGELPIEPGESAAAEARAGLRSQAFGSLSVTNFRYLLSGTLASSFAMWMEQIGQGWLVAQLTNSPFQLGLVQFIRGISILFVSPFVGGFSERVDRRVLAGAATIVNGLGALAIAVLIVTHHIAMWQIYITAFTGGFSSSIYNPLRQFLVYDTVEFGRLPNAIALNAMANNMARVVGPGITGFMLAYSVSSVFFGESLFFLAAAASLAAIRLEQEFLPQHEPVLAAVSKGAGYLLRHRALLRLTLLQAIPTLLVFPYLYLMPLMAQNYLHVGAAGYGWLQTGVGIGAVVAGVVVAGAANVRHKGVIGNAALVFYVSMILAFSFSRVYFLSLFLLIVGGVGFITFSTFNQTLVQVHVEDEYRGRVLSLYTMAQGLNPLGSLIMGSVASEFLGIPHTIAVFCVAAIILALFSGLTSKEIWDL